MRSRGAALAGSALFFLIAPGTFAGYLPWLISRWRFEQDFGHSPVIVGVGWLLLLLGAAVVVESFIRFAWKGLGTPAPIAPTERLIVTGLYRYVRNPMYASVVAIVLGQALLFGQAELLAYGALLLLGFHLFVTGYEERSLAHRYRDGYAAYRAAVPRWLPRLWPWKN